MLIQPYIHPPADRNRVIAPDPPVLSVARSGSERADRQLRTNPRAVSNSALARVRCVSRDGCPSRVKAALENTSLAERDPQLREIDQKCSVRPGVATGCDRSEARADARIVGRGAAHAPTAAAIPPSRPTSAPLHAR